MNLFDVNIFNKLNHSYDFAAYHKLGITNVQIKTHCNIWPNKTIGVFKGFLSRALNICSQKSLAQEIAFLITVFGENGYNITVLEKVSSEYI